MDPEKVPLNYKDEYPDAVEDVSKAWEMAKAGDETETIAVESLRKARVLRDEANHHEQKEKIAQRHSEIFRNMKNEKEALAQNRFANLERLYTDMDERTAEREEEKAEEYKQQADNLESAAGKEYDDKKIAEERLLTFKHETSPEYSWEENREKYNQARSEIDPAVMSEISHTLHSLMSLLGSKSPKFIEISDEINNEILHGKFKNAFVQEDTGWIKGIEEE